MKKIKKIFLIMLCVVMALSIAACGKKQETLAGTWKDDDGTIYVFNEDRTGSNSIGDISVEFTYEFTDDEIKIVIDLLGQKQETTYKYTIDGKTLSMESNTESMILTKQ